MKRPARLTDTDPGCERLSVQAVARMMVASEGWVRAKVEEGVIPGVCDRSGDRANYVIFKTKFAKYMGLTRAELMDIIRQQYSSDTHEARA